MVPMTLAAPTRTEFGKGAARRTRRAGNIPAVVYGHGTDPIHVSVNNLNFLAIIREEGVNAVISLDIDGTPTTALVKSIAQHSPARSNTSTSSSCGRARKWKWRFRCWWRRSCPSGAAGGG